MSGDLSKTAELYGWSPFELRRHKKGGSWGYEPPGGRGILIFKKHSTGELNHIIPLCGMSSFFLLFLEKKAKS